MCRYPRSRHNAAREPPAGIATLEANFFRPIRHPRGAARMSHEQRRAASIDMGRTPMHDSRLIGAIAFAVALLVAPAGAAAHDDAKYPDLRGQWDRIGPPNWTPAGKPPFT